MLRHGQEMVDSVSTNPCSPSFPVRDVAMIPDLLPIFLRSCKIKSAYSTIMHFSEMINPFLSKISIGNSLLQPFLETE